jgi:hypothetical protein
MRGKRAIGWLVAAAAVAAGLGAWWGYFRPPARRVVPSADAEVWAALDQRLDVDWPDVPLADALADVAQRADVPIALDAAQLDARRGALAAAAATAVPAPVNEMRARLRARGITLRSALRLALRSHELAYAVEPGGLRIVCAEDEPLVVRVHPLGDLAVDRPGTYVRPFDREAWAADFDPWADDSWDAVELADAIQELIRPETWPDYDGPGHIEIVPGALIIAQREEVQEQFARLLEQMRRAKAGIETGPPPGTTLADEDSPAVQAIRRALATPVSLKVRDEPLGPLLERLAEEHQFNLDIDEAAIGRDVLADYETASVWVSKVPLGQVLASVLSQGYYLNWNVQDEVYRVTSYDGVLPIRSVRIYPASGMSRERGDWSIYDLEAAADEEGSRYYVFDEWPGHMVYPVPCGIAVAHASEALHGMEDLIDVAASNLKRNKR